MKYKVLSSLYYQDKARYEMEYNKRIQAPGTLFFGVQIHESNSFMLPDWEILSLIEEIGQHNAGAAAVFSDLPVIAREYYQRKCLFDEIEMTNDIEGIDSTKEDIERALSPKKKDRMARFAGMAKKYEKLLNKETYIPLQTARDIRDLYDEIVRAEVEPSDQPDGALFRKGSVYVVSPTGQKRHEGVFPEEKITLALENALHILEKDELPILIRIAIFHYFFGYIHPFYDGNGRVSRFISSYLLMKNQFPLLALELSYTIKDRQKKYYKAFQICNDKRNKGDITPFVILFLELVKSASVRLSENLWDGYRRLVRYQELIYGELFVGDKDADKKREMILYFVQNALFAPQPFLVSELLEVTKSSRTTLDTLLKSLMEGGYPIEKIKQGKYNRYGLALDRFEEMVEREET